jgi:membrane associated rhomboid family serine protease
MSEFRYHRPSAFPPVVKNLIIINFLVWIAQLSFHNKDFDLTDYISLYPVDDPHFKFYQLITHMFAHAAYAGGSIVFYHILFNMFALWMFGRVLENVWGGKRFLFFYLACGIGAAVCHLLVQHLRYDPNVIMNIENAYRAGDQNAYDYWVNKAGFMAPAVGASGAIMGVLAAFAYLFPNTELFILPIPVPIKAKWAVIGYVAIDLFLGLGSVSGDNVAHFAHLGGAITGFIIVFIWNKTNRRTLY